MTEVHAYPVVERPPHVPADHVVAFDYLAPAGLDAEHDTYAVLKRLHDGPDIVWTPYNGGHWIVTRADDVKWVQETFQIFSHEEFAIPREHAPLTMPPLTVDPPLHARFRAVINPAFTASRVAQIGDKARALTIDLIERMKPNGGCEFVAEFARIMPIEMFLGIVDLPITDREKLVEWAVGFITAPDQATRLRYIAPVVEYLTRILNERFDVPAEDLLSRIAAWRRNPRFGGEHEVVGMALLVYFGGLDTVANLLSFTTRALACEPALQQRLRDEPEIIPRAAEEFIRRFGLSNTGRLIKEQVERKGVTMQKDEMVMVPIGLSSIDERRHPDPFRIDFDRADIFDAAGTPSHNTFGNGPHKCVGAPLARAELRIFLEEFTKRLPTFRLDPARPAKTAIGNVNSVEHLHLLWDDK